MNKGVTNAKILQSNVRSPEFVIQVPVKGPSMMLVPVNL